MSIEVKVNGENALHAAAELRNFHIFMQESFVVPKPENSGPLPVAAATVPVAAAAEAPKPAKAPKVSKATPPADGSPTLEQCMTRARAIAGDGKDKAIMDKLIAINTGFGITRARDIPAEKLRDYMASIDKEFPPQAEKVAENTTGNMFD